MKKGLTHIIFVVDRSGSMSSIADDMIGGYNTFIKKQKETPDECFVSFYQFDTIYETVFERIKLQDVKNLDNKTYVPRNCTALYDAMGKTIDDYGKYLFELKEEERPERVLFVIITDGLNNASNKFNLFQIREKVKLQSKTYKWDFVFMGSNIDAWEAGQSFGIVASAVLQFANTKDSVKNAFGSLATNTTAYRSSAVKSIYNFTKQDLKDQDEFLDDKLKSKNQKQQQKSK